MSEKEVSRGKFNFDAPIVNGRPAPYRHIGKYRVRADARDIVTGRCTFLDDYSVPRMIYAQVLRSPYPHALITKIDVEKARSFPGVHAVITYKDMPKGWSMGWPVHKDLMAQEVYYVGDPVAVIAADTVDIARDAMQLIEVEYKQLPAVFDAIESLKPDAPVL